MRCIVPMLRGFRVRRASPLAGIAPARRARPAPGGTRPGKRALACALWPARSGSRALAARRDALSLAIVSAFAIGS
ncbi:MAG: hypothetical protein AAGA28_15805 [Pseudomonadota bacterium]